MSIENYKNLVIQKDSEKAIFNKLYGYFKQILGLIVLDDLPKTKIISSIMTEGMKSQIIDINYSINQNSKTNLTIDFNVIMNDQSNNIILNLNCLVDLLEYLINKGLLFKYFQNIKHKFLNMDYKRYFGLILMNILNINNQILTRNQKIHILIDNQSISIYNKIKLGKYLLNKKDENYNIEDLSKEVTYEKLLYSMIEIIDIFQGVNLEYVRTDIFEMIDLMYYDVIEEFDLIKNRVKDNSMVVQIGSINIHRGILNHRDKLISNDYFLTPLFDFIDIKLPIDTKKKNSYQFKFQMEGIFNGRFFFPYIFECPFDETKFDVLNHRFRVYWHEIDDIMKELNFNFNIIDDKLFSNFGTMINQFCNIELTLINADNGKLSIDLNINVNEFNNLSEKPIENVKSLSIFHKLIDKKDLIAYKELIIELKDYMISIFYTYPLHSTIIGCCDLLYYFNLYNYFPLLRQFQIPLVENVREFMDNYGLIITLLSDFNNNISNKLHKRSFYNAEKRKILDLFTKSKNEIEKEITKFEEYVIATIPFLKEIGMNFGDIDRRKLTQHNDIVFNDERMDKYHSIGFTSNVNSNFFNFEKLKSLIDFSVKNEYYYDINYFIENFVRIKHSERFSPSFYSDLLRSLNNVQGYATIHDKDISDYIILYPVIYQTIEVKRASKKISTEFIFKHAGFNILFREFRKKEVIITKLNRTRFLEAEINEFKKVMSSNIIFERAFERNDLKLTKEISKYEFEFGLICNVDIYFIKDFFQIQLESFSDKRYLFVRKLRDCYLNIYEYEKNEIFSNYLAEDKKEIYDKVYSVKPN